jgi:hypothetical protein
MGFTSQDDLINQITVNGKYLRRDGSKQINPASTATACWRSLMSMAGNPPAMVNSGTTLVWKNCDEFSGDGITSFGIQKGGGVLNATKHIINVGMNIVAAAGGPWQAKLVDLQGYYPLTGTDVTGTGSRALVNSNTVTFTSSGGLLGTCANNWASGTKVRFTTAGVLPTGIAAATDYWLTNISATTVKFSTSYADYVAGTFIAFTDAGTPVNTMTIRMPRYTLGAGCQAAFVVTTQPTAGGPTISASSYTNSAGTAARAFSGSPTFGATADAYAGRIPHSGLVAGRFGPFLPLQGSDAGVASIESFTLSAGTAYTGSGVLALCIMRPLLDLSIPITGMYSERDLVNQLPSMPQVQDGACLTWLIGSAGATTSLAPVTFTLDFGWGG